MTFFYKIHPNQRLKIHAADFQNFLNYTINNNFC